MKTFLIIVIFVVIAVIFVIAFFVYRKVKSKLKKGDELKRKKELALRSRQVIFEFLLRNQKEFYSVKICNQIEELQDCISQAETLLSTFKGQTSDIIKEGKKEIYNVIERNSFLGINTELSKFSSDFSLDIKAFKAEIQLRGLRVTASLILTDVLFRNLPYEIKTRESTLKMFTSYLEAEHDFLTLANQYNKTSLAENSKKRAVDFLEKVSVAELSWEHGHNFDMLVVFDEEVG